MLSRHWRLWLSFPLLALPSEEITLGRFWGERRLLGEKFRNLNRRGQWPLVSVEKDSHAQPPLAAMAVFPLSPRPLSPRPLSPEERLAFGVGVSA